MSIELSDFVEASGGRIVGKVRFQKLVYLLDQIGLNSGFDFSYHHYGPYSEALADQIDIDLVFEDLQEENKKRLSDGVPYSVFSVGEEYSDSPENLGDLSFEDASRLLRIMNSYSSTELELAATAHWLANYEGRKDWERELIRRKGIKTKKGRKERGTELLEKLNIGI